MPRGAIGKIDQTDRWTSVRQPDSPVVLVDPRCWISREI